MAVTKQTYTVAPTWTASQLADIFRSAFIDAGLMAEWHDSFLSGSVENRVLEIIYDGAKTYGKTYYWFMFTTSGAFWHVATGWNTSTHQPAGTQYLDFFTTTTNATTNHLSVGGSISNTTVLNLIRYASGAYNWFALQQASLRRVFTITPPSHTLQSWLNLDRGIFSGLSYVEAATENNAGMVRFVRGPSLRRELTFGSSLIGDVTASNYNGVQNGTYPTNLIAYSAPGNVSNAYTSNLFSLTSSQGKAGTNSIVLPVGFTGTNPAYAANSNPVFHSLSPNPYTTTPLNSDFGITFHYATNVFDFQDKFIVTAGTEEWETLAFANNAIGNGTAASPAFLARVV